MTRCLAVAGPAAALAVVIACGSPGAPAAPAPAARPEGVMIHVAPDGDDRWTGRLAAPDAARRDGPFASLEAARDAARAIAATGMPAGGITIELRGGRYERRAPFVLDATTSGTHGGAIRYRARAGETVIIDGGRPVTGLAPITDPAVLARLDPAARGHVLAVSLDAIGVGDPGPVDGGGLELFYDHRAMPIARWPNDGFTTIPAVASIEPFDVRGQRGDRGGVLSYDGDRPARWLAESDPWVHGYWFWDWAETRQPIAAIDAARHTLTLAPPMHHYGYRAGQWYYAFNLLAELDAPGEWYLDRAARVLYFWPPGPGRAEVSVAPHLLTIEGGQHLAFQGLIFEAARGDAITVRDSRSIEISDGVIRGAGGWGVKITGGANGLVMRCEVTDTGEGGIRLEGGDRASLVAGSHYAIANHIHHYSRWRRMVRAGIELIGVGNHAEANRIHDAPHIAIAFSGNDHEISQNRIERVCQEANDAGALSAGRDWTMRGTRILRNTIRDVRGFRGAGCNGVMLDDMFSGTVIDGNTFERVSRPILIGGGRDNVISNNRFTDCDAAIRIDARGLGWAAYSIAKAMRPALDAMPYRSPPWAGRYPHLAEILDDEPAAPKYNQITRNTAVRCPLADIDPKIRPLVEFADNTEGAR